MSVASGTMADMNPQQKAIANLFLDIITAVDVTGETALPEGWLAPFADQLGQLDAASIVEDGAKVRVDLTPMVSSAALLVGVLIDVLATSKDADRLAVVHTVREHIANEL